MKLKKVRLGLKIRHTRHNLLFGITRSAVWTDGVEFQLTICKFIFCIIQMRLVENRLEDIINPSDVNQLIFQTKLRVRKKFFAGNML